MNLRIGGPGTSHRPWLLCAASAAGLRKETADVIVRLSPIVFLPPRHFGPALTGARVWAARRCQKHSWMLAWYARQGERFAAVRRHCIHMPFVPPRLIYNPFILQKRRAANEHVRQKFDKRHEQGGLGAIKRHLPRAIESRHQNGRSHRVAPLAVRPKNGAARFAVLPSVEPQAALLCQGRILKPRNKSARQNRPRKG